jgi:hypothetical protein
LCLGNVAASRGFVLLLRRSSQRYQGVFTGLAPAGGSRAIFAAVAAFAGRPHRVGARRGGALIVEPDSFLVSEITSYCLAHPAAGVARHGLSAYIARMPGPRDKYITKSDLKPRGWSASLTDRLLSEPDRLACNPHYLSGPEMRLYRKDRVISAEQHPDFRAYQDQRAEICCSCSKRSAS